jgi:uncharacterized protein (DUF433 family)
MRGSRTRWLVAACSRTGGTCSSRPSRRRGNRISSNASRFGQRAMPELISAHLERVDWDAAGLAARLYPFTRPGHGQSDPRVVAIEPGIAFGRPMIASRGVPVAPIAARFNAGETVADLAEDYGVDPTEVEEAVRWFALRSYASAA